MECVVSATLRPPYSSEWPGIQGMGGWMDPGPVWTGAEKALSLKFDLRTVHRVATPTMLIWPILSNNTVKLFCVLIVTLSKLR
jgi:hypothetical protein